MSQGIVLVDHGSRQPESNQLLEQVVRSFVECYGGEFPIVEPAHMELADPTIAQAFDACVVRGATEIIVSPYFLGPGRHWTEDIPRLVSAAASQHPGITWKLAPPLGNHLLMLELLLHRIREVL